MSGNRLSEDPAVGHQLRVVDPETPTLVGCQLEGNSVWVCYGDCICKRTIRDATK